MAVPAITHPPLAVAPGSRDSMLGQRSLQLMGSSFFCEATLFGILLLGSYHIYLPQTMARPCHGRYESNSCTEPEFPPFFPPLRSFSFPVGSGLGPTYFFCFNLGTISKARTPSLLAHWFTASATKIPDTTNARTASVISPSLALGSHGVCIPFVLQVVRCAWNEAYSFFSLSFFFLPRTPP